MLRRRRERERGFDIPLVGVRPEGHARAEGTRVGSLPVGKTTGRSNARVVVLWKLAIVRLPRGGVVLRTKTASINLPAGGINWEKEVSGRTMICDV